jgi:DNA polymerase-3 subunit epsilon
MNDSYIVFDIETTGLQPKTDRIIEIGAVKVKKHEIIDTFSILIDAKIELPPYITALTGINNEMLKGAKGTEESVTEFIDFCEDYILMGHNVIFDYSFVKRFAANHKLPFEKKGIDTLKIARKLLPNLEKKNLGYLCDYYKIKQVKKHRALEDATATKQLYDCMLKQFGESHSKEFAPYELIYQVKRESPITDAQKGYLKDLMKYHKIELDVEIDTLTKNEASRRIDYIILQHGRIIR